jgi:2-oxoglutarate ferredoxin oxidoreductase subunit alpha
MAKDNKKLMSGNEALSEAAIQAGCRHYFGYPITPQNEITAYMAKRMPEVNGTFIQSESELAAINMVFGASAAGARAMTSSSSPGISLKQEGISYMAGAELPGLIVNMVRGGPGLGNISPAQSDYFQSTKGGGHGDYRLIVFGPDSVQELVDTVPLAFNLSEKYRNPVMILGDGLLAQLLEPVVIKTQKSFKISKKSWALTGAKNRPPNIIRSLLLGDGVLEAHNNKLQKKYKMIESKERRYEAINTENADVILVAFGTSARICKGARQKIKDIKVGLIRPITLWPFPSKIIEKFASKKIPLLVVEMNAGQMVEDVRLAAEGKTRIHFHGRTGGSVPTVEEIIRKIKRVKKK